MNIKATTALFLLTLNACSTTPQQASDQEIITYFKNLKVEAQMGEVEHKTFGRMKTTQPPYITDYNECQTTAFSGQSFMFGDLKVSDPKKLYQYSKEQFIYQMFTLWGSRKYEKPDPIFNDQRFIQNHDRINVLNAKTLDCIKDKGWEYISEPASKTTTK